MEHTKVDVERQLQKHEYDLILLNMLQRNRKHIKDILAEEGALEEIIAKVEQRRNQMRLLVDIHHNKLHVHRADNGEKLPVKFWA